MTNLPPPWIIFLVLVPLALTDDAITVTVMTTEATTDADEANVTLTRMDRGTSVGDVGLGTQFPTYYLARSYTNEAGERRNVLIPVQGTAEPETTANTAASSPLRVPVYQDVSPTPTHSPTQIYALSQDMLMTLHKAGLISEPPQVTTLQGQQPTQPSSNDYTDGSSVYTVQSSSISSPAVNLETLPVPAKLESPTPYTPANVRYRPSNSLKSQVYLDNSLKSQAYLAAKLKTPVTKLYNVNFRNRINTRPNKNKYTSTKLQYSLPTSPPTAESPYTNKVRFELEDARVPKGHSIALQPIQSTQISPSQAYTATTPTTGGLSHYLEAQAGKQFYVAEEGQQVEYVQSPQSQSAGPTRLPSTVHPHYDASPVPYIRVENNGLGSSPQYPTRPTLSSTTNNSPQQQQHYTSSLTSSNSPQQQHYTSSLTSSKSPQQQHYTSSLTSSNTDDSAPHVEYVQITDIEVAPRPQSQQLVQPKPRVPYSLSANNAQKGRIYQHYHQHVPQRGQVPSNPNQLQQLLKAQNLRVNPRPQVTFASDSGLRSALTAPAASQAPNLYSQGLDTGLRLGLTAPAASQTPILYTQANIKPTVEPDIEFIQSNEVTFAPEIMEFDPAAVRQQNAQHAQSDAQYVQETNSVTPAPAPKLQQYQQYSTSKPYSTSNPNEPTPSIELEYTPGKFPPMVQEAYNILKHTSQLPTRITPDNIDGSIKTLGLILQRLQEYKQQPNIVQQNQLIQKTNEEYRVESPHPSNGQEYSTAGGSTPGRAGIDYPNYHKIPKTSFDCSAQRYKGFFGDPDTRCQVWHYCDLNGGQASFLCPNGTIFSQVGLTCDWWYNVKCSTTSQLYVLNERLYKYILPFSPSFPEDYSGPGVDRYLTAKFEEQEAKNKVRSVQTLTTTPRPSSSTEAEVSSTPTTARAPMR